MSFKDDMIEDLDAVFFNLEEHGEQLTLTRGDCNFTMKGLYDVQCLDGETLEGDVSAISHRPCITVSSADLPGGVARKGDLWTVAETPLHRSASLRAVDFASEADGVVVIQLEYRRATSNV